MEVSIDDVRAMARVQNLNIPENELDNVATRLSTWLTLVRRAPTRAFSVRGDEPNLASGLL